VAYDYILKPAADIAPKISSPPKEKPLTHNEIFEKLQKAEARRQVRFYRYVTGVQGPTESTLMLFWYPEAGKLGHKISEPGIDTNGSPLARDN
jgi:hypothetical protein